MKPVPPYYVIRDIQEKVGYWEFDVDSKCAGCEVRHLVTGDYVLRGLEDKLCIERKKTVAEFANNIFESRFYDWVDRLSKYPHPFLIFEFSIDNILSYPVGSNIPKKLWSKLKATPEYMLSVIAKLQVNYGINVIFAGDMDNALLIAKNIMYRTNILYST